MKRTRNGKRTRGMAMVEMVFVLPLLLLLVFAIAEFGLMFSRWLTLSNAVREGARTGVAWQGKDCASATPPIKDQVQDKVVKYANAGGVPISKTDVNVTGDCAGAGTSLTVWAKYDFKMNIPYASLSTIPIGYSSTMRNE
jgi:Flp pilus assembly protein TadG